MDRLQPHLERTRRGEVLEHVGGLAGLFALETKGYRRPVLVSACDGLGAKLEVAHALGRHDSIGTDLVALVVDDLAVTGAEPLFFLDYVATGTLDPDQIEQVVAGMADGCEVAGCALLGGRVAEQTGVIAGGRYDVAGFAVGVVDAQRMLGPGHVEEGDAIIAMASTGLHAHGYELARRVVVDRNPHDDHGLLVQSLGDALLRPSRIYSPDCRALAGAVELHALCHVTDGGIARNLARELPDHLGAAIDTRTFEVPRLFRLLQEWGDVEDGDMWRRFNMGAGMLAVVDDGERAANFLRGGGLDAWVCGTVVSRPGVHLAGAR
jgi:phosphoribosylformylglycinamidine cyclo-ligase